jgi:catechol 2,3-dioxygenase-like lactoylglutathione lyase family enzyme
VRLHDPEGNRLRLVESSAEVATGAGPWISHAFVNTLDLAASAHFYREVLGLKVANESERWIEFGTGDSCLALHASQDAEGLPLHPDQRVSFALHRDDFDAWTEELRGRGVRFAAAPVEEDLGVIAEVEDADGWCVVLHGPAAFEEGRDDAAFEEDGGDSRGASWSDEEDGPGGPEFGSRKQSRKRRDKLMTRALHAFQRGEGGLAPRGTLPREPREPRS